MVSLVKNTINLLVYLRNVKLKGKGGYMTEVKKNWLFENAIIRAWKDKTFKQELLSNTKVVLKKEFGTALPDDIEVQVLEENRNIVYLVLPAVPPSEVVENELPSTIVSEQAFKDAIAKAWKNKAFKQELLKNPKATLKKEFGTVIPDHIEINVLEETQSSLYLVLPISPLEISDLDWFSIEELSDAQLESVAGGVATPTGHCITGYLLPGCTYSNILATCTRGKCNIYDVTSTTD